MISFHHHRAMWLLGLNHKYDMPDGPNECNPGSKQDLQLQPEPNLVLNL
jgi:hypothetical protein